MALMLLLPVCFCRWVAVFVVVGMVWLSTADAVSIKCGVCEQSRCPELHYCEGEAVKDHCGCCTVCSSSKYQPHPLITHSAREGGACSQVECPKFKVCVENIQGLPLCTCPSSYLCRNRKRQRPVCGTDGITYESRCFLRIAACNAAVKIKVARKGPCSGADNLRSRACESFSTCRKRKNQRTVCGTDGKSYISRCHMKIMGCQRGVKIKVKNHGICESTSKYGPSSDQRIGTSGVAMDTSRPLADGRRKDRRRKRKKSSGNDPRESDDEKEERRKRRREKRRKRKERRRKRRKAKGRGRSRRYKKLDKSRFHKTFGHITWKL